MTNTKRRTTIIPAGIVPGMSTTVERSEFKHNVFIVRTEYYMPIKNEISTERIQVLKALLEEQIKENFSTIGRVIYMDDYEIDSLASVDPQTFKIKYSKNRKNKYLRFISKVSTIRGFQVVVPEDGYRAIVVQKALMAAKCMRDLLEHFAKL